MTMTYEQFIASRHEGIENVYYAGGALCIYKPDDETGMYHAEIDNIGAVGPLDYCERALFDALACDFEWSEESGDHLDFDPYHPITGRGTLDGMTNLLADYCAFYGLTPASADEMLADDANEDHAEWLQAFIECWNDIE